MHNYQASGKFIPISEQGTINLYFGNNPYTSGIGPHTVAEQYGQRVKSDISFATEYIDVRAQVKRGETTYAKKVFEYVSQQPYDWLELMTKKVYYMFLEPDWKLILTSFVYPRSSEALKNSPYLQWFPTDWVALLAMSLLSLIFVRNRATYLFWLVILVISVVIIIFFVKFRFRLSLVPLMLLLSMAVVGSGRNWLLHNPRKFILILLILLALLPFIPSLLIFIILYVAIALFPYRGKTSLWRYRWPLLASWRRRLASKFLRDSSLRSAPFRMTCVSPEKSKIAFCWPLTWQNSRPCYNLFFEN